jgi:hypothetical protein
LRFVELREIFRLNKERDEFLERLAEMVDQKGGPTVYAWALMPNHKNTEPSLSRVNEILAEVCAGSGIAVQRTLGKVDLEMFAKHA